MNENYSNAILARCKGQGAEENVLRVENWPTVTFAKPNKKVAVPLRHSFLHQQFACGSQFFAFDRVDFRIA